MTKGAGSLFEVFLKGVILQVINAEHSVFVEATLAKCACSNGLFDRQETLYKPGDKACHLVVPILTCVCMYINLSLCV